MNFDNHSRAIFAVFGAQIIWGVAGPLVKIVLADIPPFGLMFLRFLFSTITLFFIYEFWLRHREPPIDPADGKKIFLAGFFGAFLNIALYFLGQKYTTVIDAWVITSLGTPFVLIFSYLFRKERLSKIVYRGVSLAFLGAIILMGRGLLELGRGGLFGNLAMLGGTLSGIISYLITKDLVTKYSPIVLTYYYFLIALVFAFPLFLWDYFRDPSWLASLSAPNLGIIVYLTLGSSIAAYTLNNLGLRFLSPSIASAIGYTSAIIAIGLSIVFLGERPTPYFLLGTTLIIIGLFLAETRHPSHPLHKLHRI